MSTPARPAPTPAEDFARYLRAYPEEMAFSGDDPGEILDRYCTPDFVQHNDGVALDRARLVAHAKPVRKNVVDLELEIHDAVVEEDRVAARYTMRSTMRKGQRICRQVYMFGALAADGRLRRVDSVTRTVGEATDDGDAPA